MSTDIGRYIEIYTEDIAGTITNHKEINKVGNLQVGDIVMCYNCDNHYRKIVDIDDHGNFTYEVLKSPEAFDEIIKWQKSLVVSFTVCDEKDIPVSNNKYNTGDIIKTWEGHINTYYKCTVTNGVRTWEKTSDVPRSWKTVSWFDNKGVEVISYYTGCSSFLETHVLSRSFEQSKNNFAGRGLPTDVSEKIKNDIEHQYGITYCTYTELKKCFDYQVDLFKNNLLKSINNDNLNDLTKKIDYIVSNMRIPLVERHNYVKPETEEDEYECETFDSVYDDEIWDVITANDEVERIDTIMECADMGASWDNIRIIYVVC